jgi:UDP-glucose 4-epimerase
MRILVTGGLGFTGRAVVLTLLAHGHQVVQLTSRPDAAAAPPGTVTLQADLRDGQAISTLIADGCYDVVCHLAALTQVRDSFAHPATYYQVNLAGTANLLASLDEQATRTGIPARIVFASTGAVYAPQAEHLTEDAKTDPTSPYGASKLAAERLLDHQAATGRLQATTLRCFNIAGAIDGHTDHDTTRIIPKTLAVAAGRFSHVQINGDGTALREYTHVRDVAEAYRLALEADPRPGHTIYNVGSGTGTTVTEIIETSREITGTNIPVHHGPPSPEPPIMIADSSRIRADLAWVPIRSDLDQIIRDSWGVRGAPA